MKNKFLTSIAIMILGLSVALSFSGSCLAESGEDIGEMDYSYGKVLSLSADEIVITEYDYEKDAEVNVAYHIKPAVELQNIQTLKDIAEGDEVEVYYDEKSGQKTALIISRPQVEDSAPTEVEEEAPAPEDEKPAVDAGVEKVPEPASAPEEIPVNERGEVK